ncbi:hypothetical protein PFISCL1PPCAC_5202, partial [Pristionchus fissidentatus]
LLLHSSHSLLQLSRLLLSRRRMCPSWRECAQLLQHHRRKSNLRFINDTEWVRRSTDSMPSTKSVSTSISVPDIPIAGTLRIMRADGTELA